MTGGGVITNGASLQCFKNYWAGPNYQIKISLLRFDTSSIPDVGYDNFCNFKINNLYNCAFCKWTAVISMVNTIVFPVYKQVTIQKHRERQHFLQI